MCGCSVRRNQWLGWVTMPISEWGPWGLHGVLQGKAPVSLVPHCWSPWYCPRTLLLPPKCLPCVLHWNVVQKCDLQVWEFNVPLNCSVSPWCKMGSFDCYLKWDPSSDICLPRVRVWLSHDGTWGGSSAMDAQEGWGGRKGGFGMAFPQRQWAKAHVPLQPAHLGNQLSQRGFLLLLSHQAEVILLPSQQRRQVCLNGSPCLFKTRQLCGSSKEL